MYLWAHPSHSNLRAAPLSKSKYRLSVILCFITSLSHFIKQPSSPVWAVHTIHLLSKNILLQLHVLTFVLDNNGFNTTRRWALYQHRNAMNDNATKNRRQTLSLWTFQMGSSWGFTFGNGMAFILLLFSQTATHSKIFTLSLWPCFLSTLSECELDKEWSQ